ncbi:MAG TPA: glycosyltransferase family 39 protein [Gemmatimonadaceae bacterium]|nr:glycosyltransferase family 39 protein [Gemmatimonadaceae bacterium]
MLARGAYRLASPTRVFLASRLAIWLFALFAFFEFDPNRSVYAGRLDVPRLTHDLGAVTDVWARWDSVPYLQIAEHGYGGVKGSPAFYPLYPWLMGGLGWVLGGHYVLAGVLLSLAFTLAAFVLFDRLARRHLDRAAAGRALVYLAVFPATLFLQAVYAESLFLLLVLAAFLAAEHRRWTVAWACVGLALITRPAGIALVPPLLILALRDPARRRALAPLPLAAAIFAAYPIVLHEQLGDATAFLHAERFWHRHVSPLGPLSGIWRALHAAWAGVLQLTVGSATHWYWTPVNPARTAVLNLEYLGYLVVLVWLCFLAWRRIGAAYGVYVAASLLIPLSAPSDLYPLLSLPRLALAMFPVFFALATITDDSRAHDFVVVVSSLLLGVSVAGWATWQWVS